MNVTEVISDAELVNTYARQVMEKQVPETVDVETKAPSDSTVLLPGGYMTASGDVVSSAEVRELNGEDEEVIARSGSVSKSLSTLLSRGVVKVGAEEATQAHLDGLLSGDRDHLLIAIRKSTFGDEFKVVITCPHCSDRHECSIDLSKDIPIKTLNKPQDRTWITVTKIGKVKLTLPTGSVQKKLMDNMDKTVAEVNTLLLANCILSVDERPVIGQQIALSLGMSDRAKLLEEILDRNPGPRLGEVKKVCKACGESIDLPLSLTDLFRL